MQFETICALATPPGVAGLSVIRVSGVEAVRVVNSIFKGKGSLLERQSHTISYGTIVLDEVVLDSVTVSLFRAPNSYTGEDVVEIGCHGGLLVYQAILDALLASGCRHADAGEFTKRAFLHGKLDLTQVESVADLIHSSSVLGSQISARQLSGGFSGSLKVFRERLLQLCALLELELDFSDEDVEFADRDKLRKMVLESLSFCNNLIDSFVGSEILRGGFYVGLLGLPNAGKSSLFNALLGKHRAIVSSTAGTTRDYIEEVVFWKGMSIHLFDTAGLRSTDDLIELEGISFSESLVNQCHLVLYLQDSTLPSELSGCRLHSLKARFPSTLFKTVGTKADLLLSPVSGFDYLVSSETSYGINELKNSTSDISASFSSSCNDALINGRHHSLLVKIVSELDLVLSGLDSGLENELLAVHIHSSIRLIGEITGEQWNHEVLNTIFSQFCIGK